MFKSMAPPAPATATSSPRLQLQPARRACIARACVCLLSEKRGEIYSVFYFARTGIFFNIYDVITSPEKENPSTYHYLPGPRDAAGRDPEEDSGVFGVVYYYRTTYAAYEVTPR